MNTKIHKLKLSNYIQLYLVAIKLKLEKDVKLLKTGTDLVKLLRQAASFHFLLLALDPSDSISSAEPFSFRLKGKKSKKQNN